MLILGINGSLNLIHENSLNIGEADHHDSAVALIKNGEIIAAFEEERLNRVKHTNKLPVLALSAALKAHDISPDEIDYFTFSISERALNYVIGQAYEGKGIPTPSASSFLQNLLQELLLVDIDISKIKFYDHHFAHAVSAYYPSDFSDSLVLTIDGFGGEFSGTVYHGQQNKLSLLKTFSFEQSLGHFYYAITHILGFEHFDEYKVMGLAAYGNPEHYRDLFNGFYSLMPDGDYTINNKNLDELLKICPQRQKSSPATKIHMDIAASLQEMLEIIVFHVLKHFQNVTGCSNLCMAGGVALNCTLNGKILSSGMFGDVFVFPGANDSGLPIGSALAAYFEYEKIPKRIPFLDPYLGSEIDQPEKLSENLELWKDFILYERLDNICSKAAQLIAEDKVIGWVQGRAEFAPRALGNRSILADSRPFKNKERINSIIKKREDFRPFAPSIPEEFLQEYFEVPVNCHKYPFMIFLLMVKEKYRNILGGVTHVNGTARVQTVSKTVNPRYWELINTFGLLTGTPVVLNTSFNNNAEPIVNSTNDSIVCFLTTDLDFLIIGDYLITRIELERMPIERLCVRIPPFIKLKVKTPAVSSFMFGEKTRPHFEIQNTFNDKKIEISDNLFQLLSLSDGRSPIQSIPCYKKLDNQALRLQLLDELIGLWHKRVIVLHPAISMDFGS